jgi:hypothetical protein
LKQSAHSVRPSNIITDDYNRFEEYTNQNPDVEAELKDDEMDGSYAKEHGVHPLGDGEAMAEDEDARQCPEQFLHRHSHQMLRTPTVIGRDPALSGFARYLDP